MREWSRLVGMFAAAAFGVGAANAGGGAFDDHDDDDSAGQPFFGFVRDRGGAPLSGAKVTVNVAKANTSLVVRTDQQGHFFIRGFDKSIESDDVAFACSMDGYTPFAQARAPAANNGVEITCILAKP
jgi:hypothetical protein